MDPTRPPFDCDYNELALNIELAIYSLRLRVTTEHLIPNTSDNRAVVHQLSWDDQSGETRHGVNLAICDLCVQVGEIIDQLVV